MVAYVVYFCYSYLQEALLVLAERARDEQSLLPRVFCTVC